MPPFSSTRRPCRPGGTSRPADRRRQRELPTLRAMIALYCRGQHASRGGLCGNCAALRRYAEARIHGCTFGAAKPTCRNCTVHCYQPAMREEIRRVMRYAGPRMTWRHPVLALLHLLDGQRRLPTRGARGGTPRPGGL